MTKILDTPTYLNIINYISNYAGLSVDCELELFEKFNNVDQKTLASILSAEIRVKTKNNYHKWVSLSYKIVQRFEKEAKINPYKSDIIIDISKDIGLTPTVVSRILISDKLKIQKNKVTEILKNNHLIDEPCLALNIQNSICSDNSNGPIIDMVGRCVGEEYEIRAKNEAKLVGLHYLDETVLRRTGFDKTPDLKLALPCLYKGTEVHWIESKAMFGDTKTHRNYFLQQLSSYLNRFGPGIVIYWYGFQTELLNLQENTEGLIILDQFPNKDDLELLEIK